MDPTSEVLSQSEVEGLLGAVQAEVSGAPKEKAAVASPSKPSGPKTSSTHSFRASSLFTAGELRRVRIKHEEFATKLGGVLSQFVKSEFTMRLTNLETMSHKALLEQMEGPTHLGLVRLDPLNGMGLLEVQPKLGLSVVARMLGAKGAVVKEERNFTDIELSLMTEFGNMVLREYASMWHPYDNRLKGTLLEHETSARFLKLGSDLANVFLLTMEAKFGDTAGPVRLAFLHSTLEPLFKKLIDEIPIEGGSKHGARALGGGLPASVQDVPIPVRACWGGLQMTLKELCGLQKDDVLMLESNVSNQTQIHLGKYFKFLGQVGQKGDRLVVRIESKV
jgi:flagellar motor switch protein FliM